MRAALALLSALALLVAFPAAQTRAAKGLDIYVVDVEGGNARLWVTPSGESVLVDTGNAGAAAVRDADRIMAAVKDAGISQIDHLITTHYHGDHVGGLPELAKRIPIKEFIDHGANVQPTAQMNNGPRKGGQPAAMNVLLNSPRLDDLWQIHFALLGGQEYTVPGIFIANVEEASTVPVAALPPGQRGTPAPPAPQHNGPAYWIKVSAQTDGSFTVTNARNGFSKTYKAGS